MRESQVRAVGPAGAPRGGDSGPTVLRIMLGARLRRLREAREISCEEAGKAIEVSQSKISRLELGRVGVRENDVARLLTLVCGHRSCRP